MTRSRDIAVAGCGPAGLAAALMLHRGGHRVTLFERFAAPRPIGSGLMVQPTGLAALRRLGLDGAVMARGARIERLFGQAMPSGRTVLDVRYAALRRRDAFGIGLHRAALFDILHGAVTETEMPLECGRTVEGSELRADGRRDLVLAGGRRAGPFDLVVDALGSSTTLARLTGRRLAYGALWATLAWPEGGFDPAALEQRYVRASTMVGVLPLGQPLAGGARQAAFFWSLRANALERWRSGGLDVWKEQVRRVWPATGPLLDQIASAEQLTFARYDHRTLPTPAEPGLIHIGDAWHSASPQLGQGVNMALLDAAALAAALRDRAEMADALGEAVRRRRAHVALYQAMSAMFTPVYQSDSRVLPIVRDRIAGPLSKQWPATRLLAVMVSGLVGRPLPGLGLED